MIASALFVYALLLEWREIWPMAGFFGLIVSLSMLRQSRRAAPTVQHIAGFDRDTLTAALRGQNIEVKHLDGRRVLCIADLARELDAALGEFRFPEDPWAKVMAHLDHEVRSTGQRALLWTDAAGLAVGDPDAFRRFVGEWSASMSPLGEHRCTLYVDVPAASAAPGEPHHVSLEPEPQVADP